MSVVHRDVITASVPYYHITTEGISRVAGFTYSKVVVMACRQCASENQKQFGSEVAIHFQGLKGLGRPVVLVFTKLVICLNCGLHGLQFASGSTIPEALFAAAVNRAANASLQADRRGKLCAVTGIQGFKTRE